MPVPAGAFWCSCRGRSSLMRRGVVTPPYGCNAGGARQRADVGRPAGGREGGTPGSSCPTGGCGEPPRLPWVAAHSGASAAQTGGTGENRGRNHPPKGPSTPDNPSVTAAPCQLPLHKEAFGTGMRIAVLALRASSQ